MASVQYLNGFVIVSDLMQHVLHVGADQCLTPGSLSTNSRPWVMHGALHEVGFRGNLLGSLEHPLLGIVNNILAIRVSVLL